MNTKKRLKTKVKNYKMKFKYVFILNSRNNNSFKAFLVDASKNMMPNVIGENLDYDHI